MRLCMVVIKFSGGTFNVICWLTISFCVGVWIFIVALLLRALWHRWFFSSFPSTSIPILVAIKFQTIIFFMWFFFFLFILNNSWNWSSFLILFSFDLFYLLDLVLNFSLFFFLFFFFYHFFNWFFFNSSFNILFYFYFYFSFYSFNCYISFRFFFIETFFLNFIFQYFVDRKFAFMIFSVCFLCDNFDFKTWITYLKGYHALI
jgi:hypothetical protein